MKTYTIDQIREAMIKVLFDLNANRPKSGRLSCLYPNELLLELVGKDSLDAYWISEDEIAKARTQASAKNQKSFNKGPKY